jgi:hypothetical protein
LAIEDCAHWPDLQSKIINPSRQSHNLNQHSTVENSAIGNRQSSMSPADPSAEGVASDPELPQVMIHVAVDEHAPLLWRQRAEGGM